jgi:acyl carrier protein
MTPDEVKEAVKDIIATIAPDEDLAVLDHSKLLRDQIELDSMDFLDIVMELRKRYGVQVPEEDYKELATLDGCVAYLGPKLEDKKAPARRDSPTPA